jgi:ketosteroid isomerase-like protein
MKSQTPQADALAAIGRINKAWLDRRPQDLLPLLHPDITLVFPNFAGRAVGRDAIVAGFADFCENATVCDYREADHQADVVGDTAVVSFTYQMVYMRDGNKSRATGRDLWVLARHGDLWLAIWRTMLDLAEQPA